jgi:hypothetical protein
MAVGTAAALIRIGLDPKLVAPALAAYLAD